MKVIVGKTAGFCFGVKNAVTKAEEHLNKSKTVYCLGELVHNKQVTDQLVKAGMNFIEDIKDAKDKVIIRSHGVEKQIYEQAKKQNVELIDLTCPKVLKIHKIAEEYANKDYYILLTGNNKHPEMIGTASFCGNNYIIIENEDEVQKAIVNFNNSQKEKLVIISQTTYSLEKFNNIVNKILTYIQKDKVEVKNTICNATKDRQEETKQLAKQVDMMIIIGGKHSSNSNKLYDLAKGNCNKVLFIETKEELKIEDIKGFETIGIMAGASTPQKSIEEVIEKLNNM